MRWHLGLGVLEIFCQFDSWVYLRSNFLLMCFLKYTLNESDCQVRIVNLFQKSEEKVDEVWIPLQQK